MPAIQELGWSQVVHALTAAPEHPGLAQRTADRCSVLTGQPLQADPTEKARVLWLGMSRGHALLKQAVEWDPPRIGCGEQTNQKRFLARLFYADSDLTPTWSDRDQVPANLTQWLASSLDESHPLPDFLALGNGQVDFVPWLFGEPHRLQPWAVLSCLRNVVAHGALSPIKAQQWGLTPLFEDGAAVLHTLFRRLLSACAGPVVVIDG